jgi:hypothetical protein
MSPFWRGYALGLVLGASVVAMLFAVQPAHAHTLTAGECTAYASDAARFMKMKIEGYTADDATETLRKMLEDGSGLAYVRDREDVERMKTMVTSMWDIADPVTEHAIHDAALNACDPENEDQYGSFFPDKHGT